jgi:hypothetical protein
MFFKDWKALTFMLRPKLFVKSNGSTMLHARTENFSWMNVFALAMPLETLKWWEDRPDSSLVEVLVVVQGLLTLLRPEQLLPSPPLDFFRDKEPSMARCRRAVTNFCWNDFMRRDFLLLLLLAASSPKLVLAASPAEPLSTLRRSGIGPNMDTAVDSHEKDE